MDGNEWMKDLRSKAEHYQEPGPDGLWEDIIASRRKHSVLSFLKAAAAAVLASAAAVSFLFFSGHWSRRDLPSVEHQESLQPALVAELSRPALLDVPPVDLDPGQLLPLPPVRQADGVSSGGDAFAGNAAAAEDTCPSRVVQDDGCGAAASDPQERSPEYDSRDFGQAVDGRTHVPVPSGRAGSAADVSAKLFYSNVPGYSSMSSGYGSILSSASASVLDPEQAMAVLNAGGKDGAALFAMEDQVGARVRHRQPVRAGVAVRIGLPGRWGIETGLTYSMLESESDAGTDARYFHTERQLHYIGIPLKLTFDAIRKNVWSLYFSAGGMLEKNIAGKADVGFIVDGQAVDVRRERVIERQVQWSVNAAAGAEFRFIPYMGLYAEPGVSWFIDNGSTIETVYKSRPVNFNLELGLRLHF